MIKLNQPSKLAGRMASKPLVLPGKHLVNSSLLGLNALTMVLFSLDLAPMDAELLLGWLLVHGSLSAYRCSSIPHY